MAQARGAHLSTLVANTYRRIQTRVSMFSQSFGPSASEAASFSLLKSSPRIACSWCTLTSLTQPWPRARNTHWEKPKSILRPKHTVALKTSKKFGRRWSCSRNTTGKKCCIWRVKKKCTSRELSQVGKLTSVLNIILLFQASYNILLMTSWLWKKPTKIPVWAVNGAKVLSQEAGGQQGSRGCGRSSLRKAQAVSAGAATAAQHPELSLFLIFRSILGWFYWMRAINGELAGNQQRGVLPRRWRRWWRLWAQPPRPHRWTFTLLGSHFIQKFGLKTFCLRPPLTASMPNVPFWISLQCQCALFLFYYYLVNQWV